MMWTGMQKRLRSVTGKDSSDNWKSTTFIPMARLFLLISTPLASTPKTAGKSCAYAVTSPNAERPRRPCGKSHDELRAIYDGMVDGLLVADIETQHFVRANASMCRMLGYSKDELLSLSVRNIHPEADLPFVVEQFQGLAEGRALGQRGNPRLEKRRYGILRRCYQQQSYLTPVAAAWSVLSGYHGTQAQGGIAAKPR